MMRSSLSYSQSLKLLSRDDVRIAKLDRLLGGALLITGPLTAGASLALIDPKTEAIALIREITNTAPARIKSATGRHHYDLLESAHTVLAATAFFEAFQSELGESGKKLAITDSEKRQLVSSSARHHQGLSRELNDSQFPLPSVTNGFFENKESIRSRFEELFTHTLTFVEGLSAWERLSLRPDNDTLRQRVVEQAVAVYEGHFMRLAADLPEFALWMNQSEHAATRNTVTTALKSIECLQHQQAGALSELRRLLAQTTSSVGRAWDVEKKLSRKYSSVLAQPIWRTEVEGLAFPNVNEGFVSTDFRLSIAGDQSRPHQDGWWERQERRVDLATFLATYVADPASTKKPLIILGHPGAGKTLLSEVIASRLPTGSHTPIIVQLRRVDADADIHQQIESALESNVREHVSWGSFCRESPTTKVIIFDGLDELIQATGVTQTSYIEKIAKFQEDEWRDGHAMVPIITSRVLVMDRVRVPKHSMLVKLEHLSDEQVSHWVRRWNQSNTDSPRFRPLTAAELLHHGDLARQPLLLFLLAIYAAESKIESLASEELSGAELYRRLLDSFILRQVREKLQKTEIGAAEIARRQAVLRRDLSLAAFAMFNRGKQSVSENDLGKDLHALAPTKQSHIQADFSEPIDRANSTVAAFFFVHVSKSAEHDAARGRSNFEFLHATFGEYLVAEYTVDRLRDLSMDRDRLRERMFAQPLEDQEFRAILAHQPLLKRQAAAEFAKEIMSYPASKKADLRDTAIELFCNARDKKGYDLVEGYLPTPFDPICRLANYTANMATLAILAAHPEAIPENLLSKNSTWHSTVNLWLAGLDTEGQESVLRGLNRDNTDRIYFDPPSDEIAPNLKEKASRIAGDIAAESAISAGLITWHGSIAADRFQLDFHCRILELFAARWPVPSLARMMPFDEDLYKKLAKLARESESGISESSARLLLSLLIDDGPRLSPDLVTELAILGTTTLQRVQGYFALPVLILRCPHLLNVEDFTNQFSGNVRNALDLFLRRVTVKRFFSATLADGIQLGASSAGMLASDTFSPSLVVPDMVKEFKGDGLSEDAVRSLLHSLNYYPEIVWPQVDPRDVLEMVTRINRPSEAWKKSISPILKTYLSTRGISVSEDVYHSIVARLAGYAEENGDSVSVQQGS
ncbi:NACHT domain-containing protein [Micromonospora sp. NPDC049282]|uniref:NACHT domain-containing protein n=1 Tax=Micromonospora sp. NPDC049282 TaxID=3364269 RepID=UPI003716FB13